MPPGSNRRWLRRLVWLGWLRRADGLLYQTRNAPGAVENFLAEDARGILHQQRRAHGAIDSAAGLAAFLAIVRVKILRRHIHDVLFAMHHAALPEFSLGGDEENF